MERELDFKERRITEMEAELKLLRNEREQFVEMGVRLEIQTKELGLIMRDQKDQSGTTRKKSPLRRAGSGQKPGKGGEVSNSGAIKNLKNYFQRKLGYKNTKRPPKGSPMAVEQNNNMMNMTTVMGRSPREETGPGSLTVRSGQFTNGSMRLRTNTERLPGDNLAKEFAVLRGEGLENPLDSLNNTIDVGDIHYQTTRPSQKRFTS